MIETKTITMPRDKHFNQRVREVGSEIRKWLKAVERHNDFASENVRLLKIEKKRGEYLYHYGVIERPPTHTHRVNPENG